MQETEKAEKRATTIINQESGEGLVKHNRVEVEEQQRMEVEEEQQRMEVEEKQRMEMEERRARSQVKKIQ